MAGKRKRSSKSGVSGAMVLCALVIGGLASVPKGVWVFLGGALIVGIGGWLGSVRKVLTQTPQRASQRDHRGKTSCQLVVTSADPAALL